MIIDKTKPEPQPEPGTAYAFPPINVVVPDQQKQQLYQAIMTLITVVLSIALTLTAQVISQAVDTNPEPVPAIQAADPLQTLGTSHFLDLAVTGDLAVGDDLTAGGDAAVTGVRHSRPDPRRPLVRRSHPVAAITITGILTDVVILYHQN